MNQQGRSNDERNDGMPLQARSARGRGLGTMSTGGDNDGGERETGLISPVDDAHARETS